MNVTLITGFLGAGKTTFLNRLIRERPLDEKLGVIVNDLSELEVDGELLRGGHRVSEKDGTLVSLFRGSISSDRLNDFSDALSKMRDRGIQQLFVETSGGSHPDAVIEEIFAVVGVTLIAVITLVDARMIQHDYEGGDALLAALRSSTATAEHLLADQIRPASKVILTKIDLIPEAFIPSIFQSLMSINPNASFAACAYGRIHASFLLDDTPYVAKSKGRGFEMQPPRIKSIVIRDPRPLHPQRFYDLYRTRLGIGLYRSKGFIWLVSRPDQVLLWNQAGGAMGIGLLAFWKAHVYATDRRLLQEERDHLKAQLDQLHPTFGDRSCEFTLIGLQRDVDGFALELKECFCDDDEIKRWLEGGFFEDPWPKDLKQI